MSPQVTVIIMTCNRPKMLAEALDSVRGQTGVKSVARVIVSENGDTGDSEEVCKQFADLPIRYLRQQPSVMTMLHLKALWPNVESPLVSILHDDDWWLPEHLENCVKALEEHPECGAVFSNFLDTLGPEIVPFAPDKAWRVWIASDCDFSKGLLILDRVSVLLACLLYSSFHYSTLVGRKEVVWESYLKMVSAGNTWDNERTFPVLLSEFGPLGYLTRYTAMIRRHAMQEGQDLRVAAAGFGQTRVKTTLWLAEAEPENTALAVKRFNDNLSKLPPDLFGLVSGLLTSQIDEPQRSLLIEKFGIRLIPDSPRDAKWLARQLLPPALFGLQRKFEQFLKGR